MSLTRNLARRALRHLCRRLEQLHQSLQSLGRRLRDSIAQLVGSHAGEAIREAIRALLERASTLPPGHDPPRMPYRPEPPHSRSYAHGYRSDYRDDLYREDRYPDDSYPEDLYRGGSLDDPEDGLAEPRSSGRSSTTAEQGLPGWLALLPPTVQLAGWCLRRLSGSQRLLGSLLVGATAAITAVSAGPLAGAVTAAAGAAVLLTSLADGVTDAAGKLATLER